jgi:hypothetical protein
MKTGALTNPTVKPAFDALQEHKQDSRRCSVSAAASFWRGELTAPPL